MAFTKHITNALIKAREEKLKLETSIPRKLEDGWEPIIKMKVNDFDCNALCDLGASISVMPNNDIDNKITTTANAIQVRINENIRLMAELRARWEKEKMLKITM